jgi:hypothetical protein
VGKRLIQPNQEFTTELPYSEVCMHLRVAGTRMGARLQPNGMVQLLGRDGREFSFPITAGEAGVYHDDQAGWYLETDDQPDQATGGLPADPDAADQHHPLRLEASSGPLAVAGRRWCGAGIAGPAGPLSWHPDLGDVSVPDPDGDSEP